MAEHLSSEEEVHWVSIADEVLVDPNVHTDMRMRLEQDLARMRGGVGPGPASFPGSDAPVSHAMNSGVVTCRPDASLTLVASIMAGYGLHALVIEPDHETVPILLSDLDLVTAALEQPNALAGEIAREPAATVAADTTLGEAVSMMAAKLTPHLLVVEPGSGVAAGMLSSLDVTAVLSGYPPGLARMLRPGPARPSIGVSSLGEARTGDIAHPGIVACAAQSPLHAVARSMAEHRVHCIAVRGIEPVSQRLTWGTVTALDVIRAVCRGAWERPVAMIVQERPLAVTQEDSLERVAELMVERATTHMVVVDPAGTPAGMISTHDVARVLASAA